MATSEQGDLHPNNADGKTSENSKTLWRRFLGDTMTSWKKWCWMSDNDCQSLGRDILKRTCRFLILSSSIIKHCSCKIIVLSYPNSVTLFSLILVLRKENKPNSDMTWRRYRFNLRNSLLWEEYFRVMEHFFRIRIFLIYLIIIIRRIRWISIHFSLFFRIRIFLIYLIIRWIYIHFLN